MNSNKISKEFCLIIKEYKDDSDTHYDRSRQNNIVLFIIILHSLNLLNLKVVSVNSSTPWVNL